jgi:hypothetical protein
MRRPWPTGGCCTMGERERETSKWRIAKIVKAKSLRNKVHSWNLKSKYYSLSSCISLRINNIKMSKVTN